MTPQKLLTRESDYWHVVPNNDIKEHITHAGCKCEPSIEGNTVIHNAFDGRDFFEEAIKEEG